MEGQKRINVDGDDYYLDLLFYHRRLRRLVAIELKLGDLKPADKEQLELYLRWIDKYERRDEEDAPIGLILCTGKKEETVRLLDMEGSGIRVASYWIEALPRAELERKLHEAVILPAVAWSRMKVAAIFSMKGNKGAGKILPCLAAN